VSASTPVGAPGPLDEDPRTIASNLYVGVRLLASAIAFLFISFVFAYFYLKAVNSNGDFRPARISPQQGFGIAILVCVLAATAAFERARRQLAAGAERAWQSASIGALALGVIVVILQIVQYLGLFHTGAGGYASVFWGWTLVFLVCWLGAVYWVETLVAQTLRRLQGSASAQSLGGSADACAVLLYTLAGIELVSYVLLYLIK
jgi:heme/copper-type cytochrome/quinol oxidase subunit 3